MKDCRYDYVVTARVDKDTFDYVTNIQENAGINQSECIRKILEAAMKNKSVTVTSKYDFQNAKELIREVNKIGVNINQIVKSVNEHFYTEYEKKKLFSLMQKLIEIVSLKEDTKR